MSETYRPPLYARVLRLRTLRPSSLLCFIYLEGMIALGVVLALAELVSWWAVPLLPLAVAVMVKLNDLIASGLPASRPAPAPAESMAGRRVAAGSAPIVSRRTTSARALRVSRDLVDTLDPVDSPRQRFRQSAQRRYE